MSPLDENLPQPQVIDCLVLEKDKVVRAMLGTCAKSMGYRVQWAGGGAPALIGIRKGRYKYRLVILGPTLDDGDPSEVAERLIETQSCGRVYICGAESTPRGAQALEFPVDFAELFRLLRAELSPEQDAPAEQGPEALAA